MLVMNTEARVHYIGDHCKLIPGINKVDDKAWSEAKKIRLVQHFLDKGVLQEIVHKSGKSEVSAFSPMVQKELIKEINDPKLLDEVKSGSKGGVAQAAAEKQDELEAPPEPTEKGRKILQDEAEEAEEAAEVGADQGEPDPEEKAIPGGKAKSKGKAGK